MAKKSMVNKNEKRRKAIELRKEKRRNFATLLLSDELDIESKFKLMKILDKTQGSSYIKYRNRCAITGRPASLRIIWFYSWCQKELICQENIY